MKPFIPDKAFVDPRSLKYEDGQRIIENLKNYQVPIFHSRKVEIEGNSKKEDYLKAKKTVYVTVNKQKKLRVCRPSADYQFALTSSCPGHCEYCYLQTTQGEKPYMKIYVNIDEIIDVIKEHIDKHLPDITTFECGSITDPVALEHITHSLARIVDFFGRQPNGRLRIITKFDNIDTLLSAKHHKHTKFRVSLNTEYIIKTFEHRTSSLEERIRVAKKVSQAGYPIGFIIAPIVIYEQWKEDYTDLIQQLSDLFADYEEEITFELIQHRYTQTAKELILSRFPNTKLDLDDKKRQLKWGPYGKYKYVYPKEISSKMKQMMYSLIETEFKNARIEYFT